MERKIGEIFEFDGEWYQCVEYKGCHNCAFDLSYGIRCSFNGVPYCFHRSDGKSVIFKKLEKVGEPYIFSNMSVHNITMQRYKVFVKPIFTNNSIITTYNMVNETISIEIKNKEDMEESVEEKLFCDKVAKANAEYMKVKLNSSLKPFDIEAAKSGKPVCTRDGRKVRIICFDRINGDYYKIVACVTAFDGDFEEVLFYGIDGYIVDSQNPKDEDLMMLPEKKKGWINICRNLNTNKTELDTKDIYNTKEEALQNLSSMTYVTTVKIEWEE